MWKPVLVIGICIFAAACNRPETSTNTPVRSESMTDRPIEDVLREHSHHLMGIDGVVSVGQGLCDGIPCIRVGVLELTDALRGRIPDHIEGHPVDILEAGPVRPRDDE